MFLFGYSDLHATVLDAIFARIILPSILFPRRPFPMIVSQGSCSKETFPSRLFQREYFQEDHFRGKQFPKEIIRRKLFQRRLLEEKSPQGTFSERGCSKKTIPKRFFHRSPEAYILRVNMCIYNHIH